ncbi:MAG: hypothetical protein AAGI92_05000 [Pseudomonadota bacterium]
MKLENIVLILVVVVVGLFLLLYLSVGTFAAFSSGFGVPFILTIGSVLAIVGAIIFKLVRDRLKNDEDNHYSRNVEK